MARLIGLAVIVVALVFGVIFVIATLGRSAQQAMGEADMSSNIAKLAFVVLFLLMAGVSVGWLGGL